jgi:hypothetical protein
MYTKYAHQNKKNKYQEKIKKLEKGEIESLLKSPA